MMHTAPADLERDLAWLKRVAGVDDDYIARWDRRDWTAWSIAMRTPRGELCPSVPQWMAEKVGPWQNDFSLPYPCVAQLWPTTVDWFAEADEHDELTLVAEENGDRPSPTSDELRRAWTLAAGVSVTPAMAISVVPDPATPDAVVGQIEAFYLIGNEPEVAAIAQRIAGILREPGKTPVLPLSVTDHVLAWEWMYG
ncbi:hypothetical protein OVA26_16815 [Microbacterium sp. SL62]|uniref:hypothetical protein n=1 Tax=Microbacterium sp. SL62 TaxID=2995139 RepID=UPI002274F0BC|nr:hypothetical protein [Microbacterium sp. SL62]MCY1718601.1 hypothetical protein [Microbacterium sp. SL62]